MNRIFIVALVLFQLAVLLSGWQASSRAEIARIKLDNGRTVVLFDNKEWDYAADDAGRPGDLPTTRPNSYGVNEHPINTGSLLRPGISATQETTNLASAMLAQGWRYYMPVPKSKGASWKNRDGRTTWYYGYWYNHLANEFSKEQPVPSTNGKYVGDLINMENEWRTGGRPRNPTELEWLLSMKGGIEPE